MFGPEELKGLKIFFNQKRRSIRPRDLVKGKIGNCIACHAAPNFTDFKFHNTGIAQAEYDGIHGSGAFASLKVPGLNVRNRNPDEFLPATEQHPNAKEPFRAIPTADDQQLADLGIWNIFLNHDFPKPQRHIFRTLCEDQRKQRGFCRPDVLLIKSLGLFKTPGVRDLGHSAPYSHTGQVDTLKAVINGYMNNSNLVRQGDLRNGDSRLLNIALIEEDVHSLVAYLQSLNEDYE